MKAQLMLATATLGSSGGGVGIVAGQLRALFAARYQLRHCLYTPTRGWKSSWARLSFALRLAIGKRQCALAFYSHIDLARVLRWLPGPRQPFALFVHSLEVWRPLDPGRLWALRNASCIIANSALTVRRMREFHPELNAVEIVHLGVEFSEFSMRQRTQALHAAAQRFVLIVGRLDSGERNKGHDQLLEAWPLISQHHPQVKLVFLGSGDDAPRLQAKAAGLGVAVQLLSGKTDSERDLLLQSAEIFAFPSTQEGFGLAAIEAAGFGVPVLATRATSLEEIFAEDAAYVEAMQAEPLANKLIELLSQRAETQVLGQRGYHRVRAQFSRAAFEQRMQSVLQRWEAKLQQAAGPSVERLP